MFKRSDPPTLHVISGNLVGKKYKLKKSSYTIGSNKKCTIKVTGEFVSDLHASIERGVDSTWIIKNNSPNGTYVNETKVDTATLTDRSIIQIGSDNRVEFVATPVTADNPIQTETAEIKKPNKNKKYLYIGLAVAAIYIPGFVYVLNLTKSVAAAKAAPTFTLTHVTNVLANSNEYLTNADFGFVNPSSERNNELDYSRSYYSLADKGLSPEKREEHVTTILADTKKLLSNAYRFDQMENSERAIAELNKVMRVVPDPRFPASQFAARQISSIRQKMMPAQ